MTFDIKKLALASKADMPVLDPNGSPVFADGETLPLSVTLKSPGTRAYQSAKHKFDEAVNEMNMRRLKGQAVAEGEHEKARAEWFAAVTESFNNFDYGGRSGFEAYKAAYTDPEIDLVEQVGKYLGDRGNFFNGLPKTSSDTSATSAG